MSSYDLVIRGGTLYDGTGAEGRRADVAVRGDRIAEVADAVAAPGATVVDAAGLAVAPGFLDVHTHDDFAALLHPEMGFKVQGGVTTVVVGNCGMGAAPWAQACGYAAAFHPGRSLPAWDGYAGYLAQLDAAPASCNVAALVGHGAVRAAVLGGDARAPSDAELDAMRAIVREGIEAGCVGLSTGLIYEPGRHARSDEIAALAGEARANGGLYATHMRDEGAGLLDSVREAIAIGERAGVPVQISHHKAAGRGSWGLVRDSLRLIDEARARGVDVTADQYPYTAASTVLAAVVSYFERSETSDGHASRVGEPPSGGERGQKGGVGQGDARDVVLSSAPNNPAWEGRSIADLAAEWSVAPLDAARRVLDAEGIAATVVIHNMSEDDVRTVMRHPTTMIGSDGLPMLHGKPHPRLYGTFARVLGTYVREQGVLPLAEAIHRMTGLSARRFGLTDRGEVRAGACADLVVFDPARIADVATYADPHHSPAGIARVFVNGTEVVRDGAHTGARPGRTLRKR
ncbi:MAG: N-acyl-D-amino-acid deacylase [Proteobacteria bacterium]|nr:MAG: N-acyl-D-amino-acid deacylase [Pseudomonadota bacterium]